MLINKKIKNFQELLRFIKESNRAYLKKINESGGTNLYLRALTAQILWLFLFYSIVQKLIPIRDFLLSNALFLVILGIFSFMWGIIKDKLPLWFSYIFKGEFFYNFDIKFLNIWIMFLSTINIVLIFLPAEFYKNIYQKFKKIKL